MRCVAGFVPGIVFVAGASEVILEHSGPFGRELVVVRTGVVMLVIWLPVRVIV